MRAPGDDANQKLQLRQDNGPHLNLESTFSNLSYVFLDSWISSLSIRQFLPGPVAGAAVAQAGAPPVKS